MASSDLSLQLLLCGTPSRTHRGRSRMSYDCSPLFFLFLSCTLDRRIRFFCCQKIFGRHTQDSARMIFQGATCLCNWSKLSLCRLGKSSTLPFCLSLSSFLSSLVWYSTEDSDSVSPFFVATIYLAFQEVQIPRQKVLRYQRLKSLACIGYQGT